MKRKKANLVISSTRSSLPSSTWWAAESEVHERKSANFPNKPNPVRGWPQFYLVGPHSLIPMGHLPYWPEGGALPPLIFWPQWTPLGLSLALLGLRPLSLKKGYSGTLGNKSQSNVLSCPPGILAAPWGLLQDTRASGSHWSHHRGCLALGTRTILGPEE